ncbi:MAG TPA: phosphoribosyltransferase family protein [Dissulfurispiraceae bacterium]
MRDRIYVFADRYDAGRMLAGMLDSYRDTDSLVLAIPMGGVPVASEVAQALRLPMDLIITRKLQIPHNPEAGFGAIGPDGEIVLNTLLLEQLRLSDDEIRREIEKTGDVSRRQNHVFRKGRPFPSLQDKTVIVIDDGLASGYTMLAAVKFLKRASPLGIVVGVPTGFERTIGVILPEVDDLVCLNVRSGPSFAVAEAYRSWYDLTEEDVLALVKRFS